MSRLSQPRQQGALSPGVGGFHPPAPFAPARTLPLVPTPIARLPSTARGYNMGARNTYGMSVVEKSRNRN